MAALIDLLNLLVQKIWALTQQYASQTEEAQLVFAPSTLFTIFLVILFFFGSGCWAVSIASMRRHFALPHFFLGIILPWIYPLFILFKMDIAGEKERRQAEQEAIQKREEEAAEKRRIQEQLQAQKIDIPTLDEQEQQEMQVHWTKEHFDKIARDAEGKNAGPWKVVVSGNEIIVLEILETEANLVYVVFKGFNDEPSKMRIPFSKIEKWEKSYNL